MQEAARIATPRRLAWTIGALWYAATVALAIAIVADPPTLGACVFWSLAAVAVTMLRERLHPR